MAIGGLFYGKKSGGEPGLLVPISYFAGYSLHLIFMAARARLLFGRASYAFTDSIVIAVNG